MIIFQKYLYFFWIPFFPIIKTGTAQCSHCKKIIEANKFSETLIRQYRVAKANSKAPRSFTVLLIHIH